VLGTRSGSIGKGEKKGKRGERRGEERKERKVGEKGESRGYILEVARGDIADISSAVKFRSGIPQCERHQQRASATLSCGRYRAL